MPRKRYKPEEIVAKLRQVVVAHAVACEPVSGFEYPANRDINRVFRQGRPLSTI